MANNRFILRVGFGWQAFEIDCNNKDAYHLAEFLFGDFPSAESSEKTIRYDLSSVGSRPMFSLRADEKRLYSGQSRYQSAYTLMNEVIFHCINNNHHQHALHAGAVRLGDRCIMLPGKSGKGKSTLTAWLIANGYHYLTDELVFLANDGSILPLTRPINLKVNEKHTSWLLPQGHCCEIITSDNGSMIPHRLLNPAFSVCQPQVTDIVFPEFKKGAKGVLTELSSAKCALYLMQSHVNARNLSGHGIAEISAIVRRCRSYSLIYGDFSDLVAIFSSPSSLFA